MSLADRERYARDRERILARNAKSRSIHGAKWNKTRDEAYASEPMRQTRAIWKTMISRCHRPTHDTYAYYGGRGITVCFEWRESFDKFLSDMGLRPSGMMIERIESTIGYQKDNCKWATRSEQMKNRKRLPACDCKVCGICLHRARSKERVRKAREQNV